MNLKKELELEIETIETRMEYLQILYNSLKNQLSSINQQIEVNTQERVDLEGYKEYVMDRLNELDEE